MQDPNTIFSSPIEEHLYRLELMEKKRGRRRILLSGTIFVLLASFIFLVYNRFSPSGEVKNYIIVPAEKFDHPETKEMIVKGKYAIILTDFDTGSKDTIFNLVSYRKWIKEYGEAYAFVSEDTLAEFADYDYEEENAPVNAVQDFQQPTVDTYTPPREEPSRPTNRQVATSTPPSNTPNPIQPAVQSSEDTDNQNPSLNDLTSILMVSGTKEVGKRLVFAIKNFDPDFAYFLSFGDGFQRRVGKRSIYSYKKSGTYKVIMRIRARDGNKKDYLSRLTIAENSEQSVALSTEEIENPTGSQQAEEVPTNPSPATNNQSTNSSNQAATAPSEAKEASEKENAPQAAPLMVAETMPSFPGGNSAMYRFINKNLNYPAQARDNEIEGKIYVQFVVQPNGKLTDKKVVRSIGYGCDKEALKIISKMPKWKPGKQNGKKVAVYYTIPIKFELK